MFFIGEIYLNGQVLKDVQGVEIEYGIDPDGLPYIHEVEPATDFQEFTDQVIAAICKSLGIRSWQLGRRHQRPLRGILRRPSRRRF